MEGEHMMSSEKSVAKHRAERASMCRACGEPLGLKTVRHE